MRTEDLLIDKSQMDLLNLYPSAAAILNDSGDIIISNKEWDQKIAAGFFMECPLNENFFEHCICAAEAGSDDALKLIINLRKVLDRETDLIQATFSNRNKENKQWYSVNIRPFETAGAILFIENITENIQAVRELRDSREKYRQQFDHSVNGIIIGTPEGEIIDANPSACKLLGYTLQELQEGGHSLIMDEKNPINAEAAKVREEYSVFEGEKCYLHKSGQEITVMMSSVIFRDKDRGLTTINSFRDITKEKEIQKKLKSEQEFIRTAIDSIPGAFYVLDTDGTFLQWNEAFHHDLGYSEKDMKNLKPVDFFVADDRKLIAEKIVTAVKKGSAETVARVMTKEGNIRHYQLNARSFKKENATYIVGTGMDITELLEAKSESDTNFRLKDQLFENSPLGIVKIDQDSKISRVNNGFRDMFGYNTEDVLGLNINDLVSAPENRKQADEISKKAFKGVATNIESVRYTKDGKKVPVLLSTVPVSNGEEVIAVYGIYVDLTAQKQLEERITDLLTREREAYERIEKSLEEKDILLQEVHHRVKNNLAVIAGLIDLQILEESDDQVFKKLSEVQSRVFSIAKIHETLYQEKNIVHIRFNSYLKSYLKFLPQQGFKNEIISDVKLKCDETVLNINQAVPAGLMINELINLLVPGSGIENLMIALKSKDEDVAISLSGDGLKLKDFKQNMESEKFQFKLVEIILAQLNGRLEIDTSNEKITICFKKNESKGSSNAFFKS